MNKGFKKFMITATAIGAGITGYLAWKKQHGSQVENKSDGNDYDEDLFDVDGEMCSDRNYVNLSSSTGEDGDAKDVYIDDDPEDDVQFDSLGSANPPGYHQSKVASNEKDEKKVNAESAKTTEANKVDDTDEFLEDEVTDDLNK